MIRMCIIVSSVMMNDLNYNDKHDVGSVNNSNDDNDNSNSVNCNLNGNGKVDDNVKRY